MGFTKYRVMTKRDVEEQMTDLQIIKEIIDDHQRVITYSSFGYSLFGLVCPYGAVALGALFLAHSVALSELEQKIEDNLDTLGDCQSRLKYDDNVSNVEVNMYFKTYTNPNTNDKYDLPYDIDVLGYY